MAAHRYWRATGLQPNGGSVLELSEFQLLQGTTRVDTSATLSASMPPTSGALSNLSDDSTATSATWSAPLSELTLVWDFGVGGSADVSDIRLGTVLDQQKFVSRVDVSYSDDGVTWVSAFSVSAPAWPGPRTKTASLDPTGRWSLLTHDGGMTVSADQYTLFAVNGRTQSGRGLVGKSSGVLQFEITPSFNSGNDVAVGVGTTAANLANYPGSGSGGFSYNRNGNKYIQGAGSGYGATYVSGDVIGVVVDFAAGSLTFYKNGVGQGVASTALAGLTLFPLAGPSSSGNHNASFTMRGRGFSYPIAGASNWEDTPRIQQNLPTNLSGPNGVLTGLSIGRSFKTHRPGPLRGRADYLSGIVGKGIGRVQGTTKDKGTPNVPVSERVRLYREVDGALIRELWSQPGTGAYSFDYIDELQTYTVLSYDSDKNFRAVVADGLTLANGGVELIP